MRKLKTAGIVILCLIVLIVIAHSAATVILGNRLKAELTDIKAKGGPVSTLELASPNVPDEENGAIIYARVFEEMKDFRQSKDSVTLVSFLDPHKRAKDPKLWNAARRITGEYSRIVPLVEEAQSRPRCRFPVKWEEGALALFPHYSRILPLARLLSADAILQAREGRMGDAIHLLEMSLKVGDSIKDEPTMFGLQLRSEVIGMTASSLREILHYGNLSESQAKRLRETLDAINLSNDYIRALQAERAVGLWCFGYAREHNAYGLIYNLYGARPGPIAIPTQYYIWRPFLCADALFFLREMNKRIDEAYVAQSKMKAEEYPIYATVSEIIIGLTAIEQTRQEVDNASADIKDMQAILAP